MPPYISPSIIIKHHAATNSTRSSSTTDAAQDATRQVRFEDPTTPTVFQSVIVSISAGHPGTGQEVQGDSSANTSTPTSQYEAIATLNLTMQGFPSSSRPDKSKRIIGKNISANNPATCSSPEIKAAVAEQASAARNLASQHIFDQDVYINPSIILDHDSKHMPEIHLVLQYGHKMDTDNAKTREVVVRYCPGNLPKAQLARPDQFFKITSLKSIEDVSSLDNYSGLDVRMMEASLKQKGGFEIEMIANPWSDTSNSYGHRTHLTGESSKYYGIYAPEFEQLRNILDNTHIVRIIVLNGNGADVAKFQQFYENVKSFQAYSFFNRYFKAEYRILQIEEDQIRSAQERPKHTVPSKLVFCSPHEACLVELFAPLGDHEFLDKLTGKLPRIQARAMPTLGYNGRQLLLLVDRMSIFHSYEESDLSSLEIARRKQFISILTAGEIVQVRIRPLDLTSKDATFWTGTVVDDLNGMHVQDIMILANAPNNGKGEPITVDLAPIAKSIIRFEELTSPTHTGELLATRPAFLVDIHRKSDSRPRERTICQIRQFKEAMDQQSDELAKARGGVGPRLQGPLEIFVLGSRPDLLHPKDILAGVPDLYIEKLNKALEDSPGQLKVIEYIRTAPGGYALISGFAGAGKTFLLANIAAALCHGRRDSGSPAKVVVASPLNSNVDSIADLCIGLGLKTLRMYTSTTEKQLAMLDLRFPDKTSRDNKAYADEWQGIENLFIAANCVKQLEANTAKPFGISDKRVVLSQLQNTLPHKALLACGLIDGHEAQQGEIYDELSSAYVALAEELKRPRTIPGIGLREHDTLSNDYVTTDLAPLRRRLEAAYKKVAHAVMQSADVIVTTLTLASERRIVESFPATTIMLDEASKASSAETYGLMSRYRDAPVLFFGDLLQTRPHAQASILDNPLADQLGFSLFDRLRSLEYPSVHIAESQRFTQEYVNFLSPTFCAGALTVAPKKAAYEKSELAQQDKALRLAVTSSFGEGFGGKAVLGINVSDTAEVTSGWNKTRHNLVSLSMVWVLLEKLLEHQALHPGRVAILCYYRGQVTRHLNLRNSLIAMAKRHGGNCLGRNPESLNDILISTIDKIQGGERDYIIIDAVATETPGILQDAARGFTVFSRGKQVAFFVYDHAAFQRMGIFEPEASETILNCIIGTLYSDRAIVDFKSSIPVKETIYYQIAQVHVERMTRQITDNAREGPGTTVVMRPRFGLDLML